MVLPHLITGCATTRKAPSQQIVVGIIGCGGQGTNNTNSFLDHPDCQVVASCNVDKKHLQRSLDAINKFYKNKDCKPYHDYRKMLARKDIDAVMIAVPDHWHELIAVEAARRGKDIYGEKPLAKTIVEQQAIVKAVREHGRIWQTGSWQRSTGSFHKAAEIVRNGLIGKITRVEVGLPSGHTDFGHDASHTTPTQPPPELDYNTWIGPSRMVPYIPLPKSFELAVELQYRRRPVDGLGRPSCATSRTGGLGFDTGGP